MIIQSRPERFGEAQVMMHSDLEQKREGAKEDWVECLRLSCNSRQGGQRLSQRHCQRSSISSKKMCNLVSLCSVTG